MVSHQIDLVCQEIVGIDDLDEYQTSKATLEELKMQNSYFILDLVQKQENDV